LVEKVKNSCLLIQLLLVLWFVKWLFYFGCINNPSLFFGGVPRCCVLIFLFPGEPYGQLCPDSPPDKIGSSAGADENKIHHRISGHLSQNKLCKLLIERELF